MGFMMLDMTTTVAVMKSGIHYAKGALIVATPKTPNNKIKLIRLVSLTAYLSVMRLFANMTVFTANLAAPNNLAKIVKKNNKLLDNLTA